jgi:hypothetical protein
MVSLQGGRLKFIGLLNDLLKENEKEFISKIKEVLLY